MKLKQIIDKVKKNLIKIDNRHLWIGANILAMMMIIVLLATLYTIFMPLNTGEVIVRIKQGDNTKVIAAKLKQSHVIRSAFWFDMLSRLTGSDRHLKAGRYVFGGNVSIMQTIYKIKEGRSTLIHLTIPEGFSLYQTLKQMERSGFGNYDSLLAIATSPEVVKRLTGFDWKTLEGFLYPETYAFDADVKPEQVFSLMTSQFQKRLDAQNIIITDAQQFYRDLILASIVEREAVREEEKPLIAGVYLNRLKKKMRLESCPTVDYIIEQRGEARRPLSYQDLEIDSPFNTYNKDGLPPHPICNPSISSLVAVHYPEATEYLYFFADFEGQNVFSKNYTEHLNKQNSYSRPRQN
ncbi:MAG: endolytic transglycosylase MltG [Candidatus Cloacimonadaceae bacterium]